MESTIVFLLLVAVVSAGNIARNKPTGGDSASHGGSPSRAVDGDRNGNWGSNSCSHTDYIGPNWWWVDLGENRPEVDAVTLYNRQDCCQDRIVGAGVYLSNSISDSDLRNIGTTAAYSCGTISSSDRINTVNCDGNRGRYLVVNQPSGTPLTLCEVEVSGNIAVGLPAGGDSASHGGSPARANDGNTNSNWGGNSCSHTDYVGPGWWTVDLGSATAIESVELYNRGDCCQSRLSGAKVLVVDSLADAYLRSLGSNTGSLCGTADSSAVQSIGCGGKQGRYVVVFQGNSQPLTLCEVKVYPQ